MKKITFVTAAFVLLVLTAFSADVPEVPVFSVQGGVYEDSFFLTLSGRGNIYYTTDGSVPNASSNPYIGPIPITADTSEVITGWREEDKTSIPAGTVIRAVSVLGGQSSEVKTEVYFVGTGIQPFFGGLPIVNLTVTPYDLWDAENGIYSNYNYEHKVPGAFQYYNTQGICDINRTVDVKVSGHGSRTNPKKSLRVYFKNTDPDQGKYLEYPLIPGNTDRNGGQITQYAKVTLRISDWQYTDLRDPVAQKLGEAGRADTAASTPVALFLNGEYWGMYECREQFDDDYVASHYGADNSDIVFFDRDWTLPPSYEPLSDNGNIYTDKIEYSSGPEDGNEEGVLGESYYRDQWRYIQDLCISKNIADPEVYAEFCANVDVDNLIDYMIVYLYSANDDWPGNNLKFWRVTEENTDENKYGLDGKWRFMIHDFDIAFESPWHDTLRLSVFGTEPDTEARHPLYATRFFAGLLRNDDFRNRLAQRTMAYLDTVMSEDGVKSVVDGLVAERTAGKAADLLRWGWGPAEGRVDKWLNDTDSFRRFAADRERLLIQQYIDVLNSSFNAGITGEARIRLTPNSTDAEVINYSISGADIGPGTDKIYKVFAGIPITLSASYADGSPARISVIHRDTVITGNGQVTFTPQANEPYTVSAVDTEPIEEETIVPFGIGRASRFGNMTVGEMLPLFLIGPGGERLKAEAVVSGNCAIVENGIVKALSPGTATLTARYNDHTYTADIVIKQQ